MGALTLKPYSDELREWDFIESEGIDLTDSFGVNLRLSIRENQIFLAEPLDPSNPWLTDKGRLFFDGMFAKSVSKSMNWEYFFENIFEIIYFMDHLNFHNVRNSGSLIFAFENLSIETFNMLYLLKQFCSVIELRRVENHKIPNDFEVNYLLNSSTQNSKLHMSTLGILLNVNPRYEGYLLNLSLRQRCVKGSFRLFNIGSLLDLTFPTYTLGSNFSTLIFLGEGSHIACQDVRNADFPIIITNTELFKRNDAKTFFEILKYISVLDVAWNGENVLNHNMGSAGVQSLTKTVPLSQEDFFSFFGLYYINVSLSSISNIKKLTELYLLNIFQFQDSINMKFLIDQNMGPVNKDFYFDLGSAIFNTYYHLPSNLFFEESETYINTQGLIKRTAKLIHFKKNAKTNWQIMRKFYSKAKSIMFFSNKKDTQLLSFNCINSFNFRNYINFQFYAVQTLSSLSFYLIKYSSLLLVKSSYIKTQKLKVLNTKLKNWLDDFFNSNGKDSFSYNSSVLVNCSKTIRSSRTNFF